MLIPSSEKYKKYVQKFLSAQKNMIYQTAYSFEDTSGYTE
jgi:hypothetical protein